MSTILELVTLFCSKKALPAPVAVYGVVEDTLRQIAALAQEVVDDLMLLPWEKPTARVTWPSLAGEDQGLLTTVFGEGYRKLVPATMWDVTLRRPIFGPVGDISWQYLKSFIPSGPTYQYRIEGGHLLINPAMPAGHTCSAIIHTNYGVQAQDMSLKELLTADTDCPLFPRNLFLAELEWRWLKQQGQAYLEEQSRAKAIRAQTLNNDSHLATLWMHAADRQILPGIFVPAGSWNV